MSLLDNYFGAMRRYSDFEGRATRYQVFSYLGCLAALVYTAILLDRSGWAPSLVILAHTIPTLAIAVRRVHDSDSPGSVLLIGLLPYLGWLIVFLFLVASPSPIANRYGESPRQPALLEPEQRAGESAGWLARTIRKWLVGRRPVPPLPEPPASLAIELGVVPEPAGRPTEDLAQRRLRLQKLRDSGMLSEAELIRLTKEAPPAQ